MTKLTRKQIAEGLEALPIETILLGASNKAGITLTAKQKAFAEEVAKGTPKAKAYRKAYNSKAKPSTQANDAYKLAQNPHISAMIEAQKIAIEAQKYQTPAHLRALTIHELTKHALDNDNPPAQRIKALELLGKITEVALFTERREVVKVDSSDVMKAKLMESIRLAMQSSDIIEAEYTQADDLLAEITQQRDDNDALADDDEPTKEAHAHARDESEGGTASTTSTSATPPAPHPQKEAVATSTPLHSISLTQSHSNSNFDSTMPIGGGVIENTLDNYDMFEENIPLDDSK
jgi:hypothetical protein